VARVDCYVGTFTKRTGTGTQAITGVGFQPTALVFWSVLRSTADGMESADQRQIFGFSDGTNHASVSHASASGSLDTAKGHRNDAALLIVDLDDSVNSVGVVSALDSDGFTVNWTTAAGHASVLINFLAIGGTEVSAVVGDVATNASTGRQSVTGLSFAPDAVLFLAWPFDNGATNASAGFGPNGVGWMTASGQGASSNDVASNTVRTRYQRSDRCIVAEGQGGVEYEAESVSLNADGFTINWLTARAGRLPYLALGGIAAATGSLSAPTSSGSASVAVAWFPKAALFMSGGATTSTSSSAQNEFSFGACDASRQRVSWSADRDAAGTTARYESTSAAILSANKASASVTTIESVGAAVVNTQSVDVTWTITNADQAEALYLILGDAPTPINYEDPCSITEPRIFAKITNTTETLKIGVHPLRDTAALGGFAEPRLIDVGPSTKVSSDVATGAWSSQTAYLKIADTDRAYRGKSETRTSFRGSDVEIYLTSNAQRAAGGPPRLLFSGKAYSDSADENLVHGIQINDLIGTEYSLFSEEKQIPQREINVSFFPGCPVETLGLGEPIIGGRRVPLDQSAANSDLSEGVVEGIYVGQLTLGATLSTPDGITLAAFVATLQAALDGGTLYSDWGPRIGFGDCLQLIELGTVPATEAGLAAVIGQGDLDRELSNATATGGTTFEAVLVAGHAIKEVLDGNNGNPSIWVDDEQVDPAQFGTSIWCPQVPGYTAHWTSAFGSDLFTDITDVDGNVRRYTLILFSTGSTYGTAVAQGARVHLDCIGLETVGDGTGTAITDYFELYRHVLVNFILQNYTDGAWLDSPQFLFSDGVTYLDRVHETSFQAASAVATLSLTGGYQGSFTIKDRASVRDIIANFNLSGGCVLAQDDYGRLFVKVLDTRRSYFLQNAEAETHRTLRDKVDILPGFHLEPKPDWQVNSLTYQYGWNDYTGKYERGAGGGGSAARVQDSASITRDGEIKKTFALPYVAHDATAEAVANYYLSLFKDLPFVAHYTRRGLCGLEDDVLDGLPITHYNGRGTSGWEDHAVWILSKTFDAKRMVCSFTALDVEALLS
jgi:hypothetical protein